MSQRGVKVPDASHPIEVSPSGQRVRVWAGEQLVADTAAALELREAGYPPVLYVPETDVEQSVLRPSDTQTHCPYKGDASYVGVEGSAGLVEDAAWTYPQAYDAVAEISGHLAFDTSKVWVEVS